MPTGLPFKPLQCFISLQGRFNGCAQQIAHISANTIKAISCSPCPVGDSGAVQELPAQTQLLAQITGFSAGLEKCKSSPDFGKSLFYNDFTENGTFLGIGEGSPEAA